jgi:hypothetical protein
VTASEFSLLSDIDTELEFLRKFAEGELEMDEMSATEAEAKGPIVVVLDESGSMSGERIAHAKAIGQCIRFLQNKVYKTVPSPKKVVRRLKLFFVHPKNLLCMHVRLSFDRVKYPTICTGSVPRAD